MSGRAIGRPGIRLGHRFGQCVEKAGGLADRHRADRDQGLAPDGHGPRSRVEPGAAHSPQVMLRM